MTRMPSATSLAFWPLLPLLTVTVTEVAPAVNVMRLCQGSPGA